MAKWIVTPETNKSENFKASISYGDNPEDTTYAIYQDVDKIIEDEKVSSLTRKYASQLSKYLLNRKSVKRGFSIE